MDTHAQKIGRRSFARKSLHWLARLAVMAAVVAGAGWGFWRTMLAEPLLGQSDRVITCPACGKEYRWSTVAVAYQDSRGYAPTMHEDVGHNHRTVTCTCGRDLGDYRISDGLRIIRME